jgi:hypothetical protein
VTAVDIVVDVAFSSGAESLYCVLLPFLHLGHVPVRHDRHTLACMDPVPLNAVTAEIANALDWVGFVFDCHLVGLHSLLDLGANII